MSRRKRRGIPSANNYLGNVANPAKETGDMTHEEFLAMMKAINGEGSKAIGRGSSGHKDVMITFNPIRDKNKPPKLSFRLYNQPRGMELNAGDRVAIYPLFNDDRKRIYFLKNENGYKILGSDSKKATHFQVTCNGELDYFIDLYERGTKRFELDWKFDSNVKLPYVEV